MDNILFQLGKYEIRHMRAGADGKKILTARAGVCSVIHMLIKVVSEIQVSY